MTKGKANKAEVRKEIGGKQMIKQCKGCYAAITGCHPLSGEPKGCQLGYVTDEKGHPKEDCPKPKSWKALIKEQEKGKL